MEGLDTRLDKNISHVPKPPLGPISPLVPVPVIEQVFVYRLVVYQDVLSDFRWIVVEKVAERFDDLCDGKGESNVLFGQFLR